MITWLMVGLLLLTESACDRGKNAVSSNKNGKNGNGGNGGGGGGSGSSNGAAGNVVVGPPGSSGGGATAADKPNNNGAKANAAADEEDIYRLTCYTCVNVSDNKMCNEWAIDTPCPDASGDFCRSLHILDSRGQSVLVSKSCANKSECSPASVGCVPVDTQKICISCCDTSYCNVEAPTNSTNARFSQKRPDRAKGLGKKTKKKKKKKKPKNKQNQQSTTYSSSSSSNNEDSYDEYVDNYDGSEDDDDSSNSSSSMTIKSHHLLLLGLGTAFSAISVFLNRAYH